jgi:hypothetical protein
MAGCASDFMITIKGLTDPDSTCVYKPQSESSAIFRAQGYLDLMFLESTVYQMRYIAGTQVANYLNNSVPQQAASGQSVIPELYVNANDIYPRKAHAKLRKAHDVKTQSPGFGTYEWVVEMSGNPIQAAQSATSPGIGVVLFELIPYSVIANIISLDTTGPAPIAKGDPEVRVVLDFYIEFETSSGNLVNSNVYTFSLVLCYGCLAPTDHFSMRTMKCDDGYALSGNLCSPGQDSYLTCVAASK